MTFEKFIQSPPDQVVKYPDPILTSKASPIAEVNDDVREAVRVMIDLMIEFNGCGLAAPQVGLPYQLFVVGYNAKHYAFINPADLSYGDRTWSLPESCLSLPGISVDVVRPRLVMFKAQGLDGRIRKYGYEGMLGRICQHEIDHLFGRLIIHKDMDTFLKATHKLLGSPEITITPPPGFS